MSVSLTDLALYSGALLVLFLTPGPVWLALLARSLSGGWPAAWPLALGVAVGDLFWPFLAILGVSWIATEFAGLMTGLRWVACGVFLWMGTATLLRANRPIGVDSRLTRPGRMAGFLAGIAAILGNPKAILFYMGVLPGFFDLARIGAADIAAIVALSVVVPLLGNMVFAWFIDRARRVLASPRGLRRLNIAAGLLLIAVGLVLPFT